MLVSPSRTSASTRQSKSECHSLTHVYPRRTKHCWQNYVDYYKCVNAKGDDFRPCRQVPSISTFSSMATRI